MKFRTTIISAGKTATGFAVPEDIVASFNSGKRVPVYVTINDYTYRSTICRMGGEFLLPLAAENRQAAGVKAGEEVEVQLKLDKEPREVEVPGDLKEALEAEPTAKAFFDRLSYSHRKEHVRALLDAKTAETRARRLAKMMQDLKDSKRPM